MANEPREIDSRVRAFGEYLEQQIRVQQQRPYSEREDIERTLQVYSSVRDSYQRILQIEARTNKLYETPINDFDLSVRSRNCLKRLNVKTLGDLTEMTEQQLTGFKPLGETSLNEIKEYLAENGLSLRTK